jgi:type IV pilus assembly protein PilE
MKHPRVRRSSGCRARPGRGFSLLELMIVLLIASILLGLALPSYQRYVQRGQRAQAVRMLLAAAACQERVRAATGFYDTTRCLQNSDQAPYRLRVAPADQEAAVAFTLLAEPRTAHPGDECGALTLDQSARRGISGDGSALQRCWGGR